MRELEEHDWKYCHRDREVFAELDGKQQEPEEDAPLSVRFRNARIVKEMLCGILP